MKKSFLLMTAALGTLASAGAQTAQTQTLTDVDAGHWAKDAIDRLVQSGVLLGYPDGSFRGTQNLTRYEAAVIIARVMDQIRSGEVEVSMTDLEALQNAVTELAGDLAALGVRVSDIEAVMADKQMVIELEARIAALEGKGDSEAVAALQAQIDELNDKTQSYADLQAQVDASAASISAINDLTALLNQDIVAVQDRLSSLEASTETAVTRTQFEAVAQRQDATDARVSDLEQGRVRVSLDNFGVNYVNRSVEGASFDVDRLTQGTFAAGRFGDGDVKEVEDADVDNATDFGVLSIGVTGLTGKDAAIQISEASINLGINSNVLVDPTTLDGNSLDYTVPAIVLSGARVKGEAAGTNFGANYAYRGQAVKFNDYFFNNGMATADGADGIANAVVATVDGKGLPFNPALTVVAGNDTRPLSVLGTTFGVKAQAKALGADLGVSYARFADRTGASVEASTDVRGLKIDATYAASVQNGQDLDTRAQAADVRGIFGKNADRVQLGGYYQGVSADWNALTSGSNDLDVKIPSDMQRYGAAGRVQLGQPLGLTAGAYAERDARFDGSAQGESFGVNAGATLLGSVRVTGFYNKTTSERTQNDDGYVDLGYAIDAESTVGGKTPVLGMDAPYARGNNYGVAISHSGVAGEGNTPLVKGLNLGLGYAQMTNINTTDMSAYASYDATLGAVKVSPFARWRMYDAKDSGFIGFDTVKGGVKVETGAGLLPLNTTVSGAYVARKTAYTDGGANTTEQLWRVGANMDRVFGEGTSFGVGYTNYSANGVSEGRTGLYDSKAFDATEDGIYSGVSPVNAGAYRMTALDRDSSLNLYGLYTQLDFRGLKVNYGRFYNVTNAGTTDVNNTFRASYVFKF